MRDFKAETAEIVERLAARAEDVARRYAPGGHVQGTKYWARCPWRDDKHANSFYVNIAGSYLGWFYDHSTGDKGDMLKLIERALRTDFKGALSEARAMLGMVNETPAQRQIRMRQADKAKRDQEQAMRNGAERAQQRARVAQSVYLNSKVDWQDTPAEYYLAARGITLDRLGRLPHAIRFHPDQKINQIDKTTGEVFDGSYPAMVTAVYGPSADDGTRPKFFTVQIHYLQAQPEASWWAHHHPDKIVHPDPAKRWWKAEILKPKTYFFGAPKKGGFVRLWTGVGPRGGKGAPLSRADGTVWITEGIEDGLSAAVLDPTKRVLAALDLANIKNMILPAAIKTVVLVADRDEKPEQIKVLDDAAETFRAQGREVSVWRNNYGGKDLNDALLLALKEDHRGAP
ncbi:toprim domain-containing protein [Roseobacter sp. N2S]|uniref:toprim domain-containing protein n=1 Tax=Roseobacter sp. N2S TaxID=2663844 RepID=UPI0028554830|nr:toprim domain-containing protein [Roseobacter sp. N2S]MDR6266554.1 hypothetical protein [Roseobacter sp. N2S]